MLGVVRQCIRAWDTPSGAGAWWTGARDVRSRGAVVATERVQEAPWVLRFTPDVVDTLAHLDTGRQAYHNAFNPNLGRYQRVAWSEGRQLQHVERKADAERSLSGHNPPAPT